MTTTAPAKRQDTAYLESWLAADVVAAPRGRHVAEGPGRWRHRIAEYRAQYRGDAPTGAGRHRAPGAPLTDAAIESEVVRPRKAVR